MTTYCVELEGKRVYTDFHNSTDADMVSHLVQSFAVQGKTVTIYVWSNHKWVRQEVT